jgi:uncharacterized membrane protein YphA (DoxX/SURF4 family)
MNVFLWILQAVLAVMFTVAGVMKVSRTKERLALTLHWVEDYSAGMVKFIGIVELLGALGLILPAATRIAPVLTPLAATGLAIIMALAAVTHARRREAYVIGNIVLFVAAAVVAWGRFALVPV